MESFNEVFDAVCEFCKKEVSSVAYNSWIRTIEPVKFENGTAYLSVNTDFKRGIIEEKYLGLLTKAFSEVLGFDVAVQITCAETPPKETQSQPTSGFLSSYTHLLLTKIGRAS